MIFLLSSILLASLPLAAAGEASAVPPSPPNAGMEAPAHRPPHRFHPPSREQVSMRMMVRQLLLARYDANHDHELSGEERHRLMEDARAARKQQAVAFIRQFDTDGDGQLSAEERAAMKQSMAERRQAKKEAHNTPRAGKNGHRRGRGARPPHGPRPPHPHMGKDGRMVAFMVQQLTMDAYDTDKNGILDTAESARLREDGARLYSAREAELLARYDADKDGRLSHDELQASLQEQFPQEAPPPHARGPINRLLDHHFDADILLNLARPETAVEEDATTPPCSPSTPSAS